MYTTSLAISSDVRPSASSGVSLALLRALMFSADAVRLKIFASLMLTAANKELDKNCFLRVSDNNTYMSLPVR